MVQIYYLLDYICFLLPYLPERKVFYFKQRFVNTSGTNTSAQHIRERRDVVFGHIAIYIAEKTENRAHISTCSDGVEYDFVVA